MSMTDLNPNFASEERDLKIAVEINYESPFRFGDQKPEANTAPVQDGDAEAVCKYIVKAPRPDSKLILQNMEEVLNSVKKKHRQKHKRKREQRKLAEMEAAAVAIATAELEKTDGTEDNEIGNEKLIEKTSGHSGNAENGEKSIGKRSKTKPLQEKSVQENGQKASSNSRRKSKHIDNKSPLKTPSPDGDILRHFQRTHNNNQLGADDATVTKMDAAGTSSSANQPKTMNAFEVMMNARNKTIGSNTPGKETSPNNSQESAINTKRKLMLQEWANKKGGAKRKLEEETRAAYVEHELENRAKRLKQMLVQGASPIQDNTPKSRASNDRRSKVKKTNNSEKLANQSIEKTKRKKRITKQLLSVESSDNEAVVEPDAETDEFLSKLNSPTKKRDSILGYFPRKESPSDVAAKNLKETIAKSKNLSKLETRKSRSRCSTKSSALLPTEAATKPATPVTEEKLQPVEQVVPEPVENTPCGRPKRSCAGKARYDYDLEKSPTKLNPNSTKKGITKAKQGEISSREEVIIDLDDSDMSASTEKLPKKLAPLFVRAVPKPSPDPIAMKARQDFLMSGVPEKMRLEMEKQKQYEQTYEEDLDYFPRVCHVQQLTIEDTEFLLIKRDFNFKWKPNDDDDNFDRSAMDSSQKINGKGRRRRSSSNTGSTRKIKAAKKTDLSLKKTTPPMCTLLPTVENKRAIIKFWKSEFDRFPTFKCYNQMREKYRFFSALDSAQDMEQVSESLVVTRRSQRRRDTEAVSSTAEQDDIKPPATAPNGELLFTEKYKPMLVEQVLVNLVPVTQLRDFLATWVNGNVGSARNSQTMDDSFDESNDSTSSISNATSNAVVLLGPVSSGKTNAVYALANDMNFNVLEINAGMKRTGKRLIQELQEATQSHQIRKDSTPSQSSSKAQKNLLRMSLNGQKLKKQNSQSQLDADSGCNADITQNTRKCLILIEDADVVFDQLDSGFTDAIYTLAASSKRPVIVMATNPNCLHLQRLMNQNTICFTPPNALNISRFMAVLSLIENCPINLDDLVSLYLYNRKDLRRTLLELQFFIQSGGDRRQTAVAANVKNESQHRTPQKVEGIRRESGFFASPTKCRLSDEENSQQPQEPDEQLGRSDKKNSSTKDVYIHRSLFEYFTCNQNEQWRIPFPVDLSLLRVNLTEVFQCSQRLHMQPECVIENSEKGAKKIGSEKLSATKRRTRTPKKTCINSSLAEIEVNRPQHTKSPLDVMCDFYENISIAALLGTHNADMSEGSGGAIYRNGITGGGADMGVDRLMPHLSEHIAHGIVEEAISVNLEAKACPYNLFNTRTERLSLCNYINSSVFGSRSQRTRALDVEPALRAICRSEKQRAMQERRSTRFYHYLRHSAANVSSFSTEPFDNACSILQINTPDAVEEKSAEA
ncbi:PREDICTED: ATPase family AAA domain-containing protein 5 isoform X1 [Rhagoletis zephyria]|uniref:ATPase family AAA domain-containing protein 5 isoform X1 n=2 Tax=Rhagoletis zephyria TaxID=28612 RepID=UPI000811921B|nr:PREDICTED: ATPase family AAA domain-containing protein 5 isoform X1 [Rhagoletis zephyria]XP_017469799.1 PREDICTED: ATPase family AAA domain-containing protein 5 isoform X1 [Rhagoletis zephyria]XP_017469800.1 PREDICTED: ATPase family AAA domain-containing protein 5 isoform X1 [Rhagoletis zephyria]XP_017469801.1 PREDICTED: ATPase family AAA domain-containing protein 5 isoform X1 [Rhagoletis zephyria]XP_017469802.1 PREDICTED: ATPase family AAA domain-containing protein 5 isoform X1 [Rhagoletis 